MSDVFVPPLLTLPEQIKDSDDHLPYGTSLNRSTCTGRTTPK